MKMFRSIKFLIPIVFVMVSCIAYAAPGDLDTSFNPPDGFVRYDSGIGNDDYGRAVALQTDGKIVVAGDSTGILVLRYNPDGSPDSGFGTGGVVTDGNGDSGDALALQPDGKIVVAGYIYDGTEFDVLVLRYNDDESLDSGFGTGGVARYGSGSGNNEQGRAVALQPDGKIVVADTFGNGTDADVIVVRFIGTDPASIGGDSGGSGCFIATPAYGSRIAKEVNILKKVRDEYLLTNELGRALVSAYYRYSPRLADWVAKHPTIRKIVRVGLYPILGLSKWLVGENPSE